MQHHYFLTILFFISFSFSIFGQDEQYNDDEEEVHPFFFGVNIGGHFANKNTALIYTGAPNITPFGIDYIFNLPQNQQTFNNHFRYPYQIAEYPFDPVYQSTIEIGLHLGFILNKRIAFYLDLNSAQLDYEQFFTVAVENPNSRSPQPDFQQIPIVGEENRFNLNLGTQLSYFEESGTNAYISLFGNINDVEMRRNFIVVNDINYEIFHNSENPNDPRPGGIGYGGGIGTGLKFHLSETLLMDFTYNFYYIQTNMQENFQPFGGQHTVGVRLLWN